MTYRQLATIDGGADERRKRNTTQRKTYRLSKNQAEGKKVVVDFRRGVESESTTKTIAEVIEAVAEEVGETEKGKPPMMTASVTESATGARATMTQSMMIADMQMNRMSMNMRMRITKTNGMIG